MIQSDRSGKICGYGCFPFSFCRARDRQYLSARFPEYYFDLFTQDSILLRNRRTRFQCEYWEQIGCSKSPAKQKLFDPLA